MAYFLELDCGRARKLACETLDELRAFLDSEAQLAPSANGHTTNGHAANGSPDIKAAIRRFASEHPEASHQDVADALSADYGPVSWQLVARNRKPRRGSRG